VKIIESLNEKMPSFVNKEDEFYMALFGDPDRDPLATISGSSDFNSGAIANELEYLRAYVELVTKTDDVKNQAGKILDKTIEFFSGIGRYYNEEDANYRNRFLALVSRNNDMVFGTKWNMIDVFKYFFPNSGIFVIENAAESSILVNGDFEDDLAGEWNFGGGAIRVSEESLSKKYSLRFTAAGDSAWQDVTCAAGTYFVNLFARGAAASAAAYGIKVQRLSDNYFWNEATGTWAAAEVVNARGVGTAFAEDSLFFVLPAAGSVRITFAAMAASTVYLDKLEVGLKNAYPVFKMLIISSGQSGAFMNFFPGEVDPVTGAVYTNASFLDQSFIGGARSGFSSQIYENMLQMIKPSGTKALFEFVERDRRV